MTEYQGGIRKVIETAIQEDVIQKSNLKPALPGAKKRRTM
jgi:hypothetical protein